MSSRRPSAATRTTPGRARDRRRRPRRHQLRELRGSAGARAQRDPGGAAGRASRRPRRLHLRGGAGGASRDPEVAADRAARQGEDLSAAGAGSRRPPRARARRRVARRPALHRGPRAARLAILVLGPAPEPAVRPAPRGRGRGRRRGAAARLQPRRAAAGAGPAGEDRGDARVPAPVLAGARRGRAGPRPRELARDAGRALRREGARVHGPLPRPRDVRRRAKWDLGRRLAFAAAREVVAVSGACADRLESGRRRARVVRNGVELPPPRPQRIAGDRLTSAPWG